MADPRTDAELVLSCRVRPREAGVALLEFLAARFRYLDRAAWAEEIAAGRVSVDGRRVGGETILRAGAEVATRRVVREPDAPTEVRIVHDEGGIVVVDKPAGLPFHADGAFVTRTVVGVVARLLGKGLLPLQRLDRETSGLCLFARDRATARALQLAASSGSFDKRYDAIVRGVVVPDDVVLDAWIGIARDSVISLRRAAFAAGTAEAQPARTELSVLARAVDASLVRCRLCTGRTHQIRVHLEQFGHPLIGDKLYGRDDRSYLEWVAHAKAGGDLAWDGRAGAPRQMLHAASLRVRLSPSAPELSFTAPWPEDFRTCARSLGLSPAS